MSEHLLLEQNVLRPAVVEPTLDQIREQYKRQKEIVDKEREREIPSSGPLQYLPDGFFAPPTLSVDFDSISDEEKLRELARFFSEIGSSGFHGLPPSVDAKGKLQDLESSVEKNADTEQNELLFAEVVGRLKQKLDELTRQLNENTRYLSGETAQVIRSRITSIEQDFKPYNNAEDLAAIKDRLMRLEEFVPAEIAKGREQFDKLSQAILAIVGAALLLLKVHAAALDENVHRTFKETLEGIQTAVSDPSTTLDQLADWYREVREIQNTISTETEKKKREKVEEPRVQAWPSLQDFLSAQEMRRAKRNRKWPFRVLNTLTGGLADRFAEKRIFPSEFPWWFVEYVFGVTAGVGVTLTGVQLAHVPPEIFISLAAGAEACFVLNAAAGLPALKQIETRIRAYPRANKRIADVVAAVAKVSQWGYTIGTRPGTQGFLQGTFATGALEYLTQAQSSSTATDDHAGETKATLGKHSHYHGHRTPTVPAQEQQPTSVSEPIVYPDVTPDAGVGQEQPPSPMHVVSEHLTSSVWDYYMHIVDNIPGITHVQPVANALKNIAWGLAGSENIAQLGIDNLVKLLASQDATKLAMVIEKFLNHDPQTIKQLQDAGLLKVIEAISTGVSGNPVRHATSAEVQNIITFLSTLP